MGPALSPATSFGSSASRQHLLDQALRLSSLRESSPSGVATVDSLRLFPACADVPAANAANDSTSTAPDGALFSPADSVAADGGAPDADPSVWETVFLVPAEPKQPWSIFEAGPMFAGEDELDAHAAAVLAAENDIDAMADAMEHAAAAVPLPPAVGSGAVAGCSHHAAASAAPAVFVPLEPARAEQPTLLGSPSPVIVVRRAGPMSELAGITTANSPAAPQRLDAGKGHFWGGGGDGCLPRIAARTAPDSSLDSFETATGYDPPEMPGQGDWSADERDGSEASEAPQSPRGGDDSDVEGGYGSEDEWTPACVRRTALRRRSRTSSSGGVDACGVGSDSNSPQHGAVATEGAGGQLARAAATRVRDIVRAFGSDDGDDDDDAGASPRQSTVRRVGGGKRRRSPTSAFESHDSDGNPRHKRHNPWCALSHTVAMCATASMAGYRPSICRVADRHDSNKQPAHVVAITCSLFVLWTCTKLSQRQSTVSLICFTDVYCHPAMRPVARLCPKTLAGCRAGASLRRSRLWMASSGAAALGAGRTSSAWSIGRWRAAAPSTSRTSAALALSPSAMWVGGAPERVGPLP